MSILLPKTDQKARLIVSWSIWFSVTQDFNPGDCESDWKRLTYVLHPDRIIKQNSVILFYTCIYM